jgi:hypothetical protein
MKKFHLLIYSGVDMYVNVHIIFIQNWQKWRTNVYQVLKRQISHISVTLRIPLNSPKEQSLQMCSDMEILTSMVNGRSNAHSVCSMWFHLYDIKLHQNRNITIGWRGWVLVVVFREVYFLMSHEEIFSDDENVPYFDHIPNHRFTEII